MAATSSARPRPARVQPHIASAPSAWPPTGISANLPLTVPATAFPISVPHQGNAGGPDGQLDALDDRLEPEVQLDR